MKMPLPSSTPFESVSRFFVARYRQFFAVKYKHVLYVLVYIYVVGGPNNTSRVKNKNAYRIKNIFARGSDKYVYNFQIVA